MSSLNRWLNSVVVLLLTAAPSCWAEDYRIQPGVAGTIRVVGSDTMANLVSRWSQHFLSIYPHADVQIQAVGSATAPTALTEGSANIGSMSRQLTNKEVAYFRRQYGYEPTVLKVALDAIVLFTASANATKGLNFRQIDGIFSATRFCGGVSSIEYWSQINPNLNPNKGRAMPIKLFGRNSVSGTYGLFKSKVLCDGDFKSRVNELPSSESIVYSVANNANAIGYGAYSSALQSVRLLPIAAGDTEDFVPASAASIASGQYPLTRPLYLIVNQPPTESLPVMTREFVLFVLSPTGQALIHQGGYVPVAQAEVLAQRSRIK